MAKNKFPDTQKITSAKPAKGSFGELDLWGPPPLLPGEDEAVYEALRARIIGTVKPRDFIEQIYAQDFLELTWQTMRLRRLKAAYLERLSFEAMQDAVADKCEDAQAKHRIQRLRMSSPVARRQITRLFRAIRESKDDAIASMLPRNLEFIERLERLIATTEARRDAVFREITRHRSTIGADLRRAVGEVEDAEFEVVAPPTATSGAE